MRLPCGRGGPALTDWLRSSNLLSRQFGYLARLAASLFLCGASFSPLSDDRPRAKELFNRADGVKNRSPSTLGQWVVFEPRNSCLIEPSPQCVFSWNGCQECWDCRFDQLIESGQSC